MERMEDTTLLADGEVPDWQKDLERKWNARVLYLCPVCGSRDESKPSKCHHRAGRSHQNPERLPWVPLGRAEAAERLLRDCLTAMQGLPTFTTEQDEARARIEAYFATPESENPNHD